MSPARWLLLSVSLSFGCSAPAAPAASASATPRPVPTAPASATAVDALPAPPPALVASLGLSPVYVRYIDVETLPILGTAKTSDWALREAEFVVRKMIGHRPDVLRAMAKNRTRLVVMAPTELTTDVPEHADLVPRDYWDRRARGLGATDARPAVSCAEENLLGLDGDPYASESILVHEFSHAIHEMGLRSVDPTFDARLKAAYENARAKGLFAGTYASTNEREYWAEGAQSWFDTNRANDAEHGPIDTREKLLAYDPTLSALLAEVFGDAAWRYQKPAARSPEDRAHLAGFDPASRPKFQWFTRAPTPGTPAGGALAWITPGAEPPKSAEGGAATSIVFENRRAQEVEIFWVDFAGQERPYQRLRAGATAAQPTFVGHVWRVREAGALVGSVVGAPGEGRAVVR